MREGRAAAFLDRDGTIIVDRDYPGDPAAVELIPGAAEAIARLRSSGLLVLMVTNQSGIGRGLITESDYRAVQARMERLLDDAGAGLDGAYYCPHAPDRVPACECRKPGLGLYHQAAREHGIDLAASCYVGDRMRDVLPAVSLGGTGYFVRGTEPVAEADLPPGVAAVDSLAEATELLLANRV
ncbi:MAG TPA: HAD family hydrolase [Longimicrobiaceae bacterium]